MINIIQYDCVYLNYINTINIFIISVIHIINNSIMLFINKFHYYL